jgi:o-succinylbenzoate---CoA ligase
MSGAGTVVVDGSLRVDPAQISPGTKLVVYTSGTTGEPKGVRLTAGNLEAASKASVDHLGHGPQDRWLLAMSLQHVGGLSILVRTAYAGGSVLMLPGFEPSQFAGAMHGGVTMVSVVATMLTRVLEVDGGPYRGLKAVLVGGGPIPSGLLERAAGAGIPALPSYGMTETFGQVATLSPGSPLEYKAHPLPGVELRVDSAGRIAVAGNQVSPGYLGEPDRADRWLITNDLGEIGEDGSLRVIGRADAVIVTGGLKVDPGRVEAELLGYPGIGDVLVFGAPHPDWGEIVVCAHTGAVEVEAVETWLKEKLDPYMVPKRWVRLVEIPRTSIGKPDRLATARLSGF